MGKKKMMMGGRFKIEYPFNDIRIGFSLRKLIEWDSAVLKIRRDSDDATAFIFFDGEEVTLNSPISLTSNLTPDSDTLGSWIGGANGFVEQWIGQMPDGNITGICQNIITTSQPQFVFNGVINTINNKPALNTEGNKVLSLSSGSDYFNPNSEGGCIGVANTYGVNNTHGLYSSDASSGRIALYVDTRTATTAKRICAISASGVLSINSFDNITSNTLRTVGWQRQNVAEQTWLGYYNGTPQISYPDTLGNITTSVIRLFNHSTYYLNGNCPEIIFYYGYNQTLLDEWNQNILNYYSIT